MKQKTSFFNWGLSRNILKRTWPLWVAYLALMLSITAGDLPTVNTRRITDVFEYCVDYNYSVMSLGISAAQVNVFAGAVAAMAVYSYMYTSRSCGMINALPIRRETAFSTAYTTGLGLLILADMLCVLTVWVMSAQTGFLFTSSIWTLLGFTVLSSVAFYSFASFCAVLTGNIIVLPTVYAVLGCVAFVVISAVGELLADIVYGMESSFIYRDNSDFAYCLSPIIYILNTKLNIRRLTVYDDKGVRSYTGEYEIQGLGMLGIYCAIALALCVCALLIYRRRDMERAGDVVAVPLLMPVFKYCMTFGTAIICALMVYHNVLRSPKPGLPSAIIITLLLLLGAVIGFYAAEMLMQKTLKVFRVKGMGLVISCVLLAAFALCAEFDVVGFEAYIPAAEEIEKAEIGVSGNCVELYEPENLAAVVKLHEDIVADKNRNEAADSRSYLDLTYTLSDGSTVRRAYRIAYDDAAFVDESSNLSTVEAIFATKEARLYSLGFEGKNYEVSDNNVDSASIDGYYYVYPNGNDEEGEYRNISLDLTPQQAAELYECIMADALDSTIGSKWFITDEEYYNTLSNLNFYMNLKQQIWETNSYGDRYTYYPYLSVGLTLDAKRTMNWLAENTELDPLPVGEADPVAAEESLSRFAAMPTVETKGSVGIIGGADGPTAIFVS